MPFEDAKAYRFNPFDLSWVWPHGDYPLHESAVTLDRNVTTTTPRSAGAFEPSNIVPGTGRRTSAAGPRLFLLRRAPCPAWGELQADR
jgi:catalase